MLPAAFCFDNLAPEEVAPFDHIMEVIVLDSASTLISNWILRGLRWGLD